MKTQCLQTNETQHYCRKENTFEAGWGRERVPLIKSLINPDRKDALEERLQKIELNLSADNNLTTFSLVSKQGFYFITSNSSSRNE